MKDKYRKVALTIALGFIFLCCKAQKQVPIEPAMMEVSYHVVFGNNTDNYALRIGKNVSEFFSYDKLRSDSLGSNPETVMVILNEELERMKKLHNKESVDSHHSLGCGDYLYTNFPNDSVSTYTSVMGIGYRIVEPMPTIDWTICEDSTRLIMGFNCHLATTTFRGREWKAWYTEDIPIMRGPWKLGGLPGLILCAEVESFISYTATVVKTANVSPVTFYNWWNKKFEDIDRKKHLKASNNPKTYPKGTQMTPPLELDWIEVGNANPQAK